MNVVNKLRARIGSSVAIDAEVAGREAAAGAMAGLGEEAPALVIVYASVAYDLPLLLASIRRVTGTVPLIGATTAGQLHDGVFVAPGGGVQVLALTAGPYSFGVAGRNGLAAGDPEDLGRRLAVAARAAADPGTRPHAAVMLLSDGMAGHQQHLLNGVYEVAGAAVPVVGAPPGTISPSARLSSSKATESCGTPRPQSGSLLTSRLASWPSMDTRPPACR